MSDSASNPCAIITRLCHVERSRDISCYSPKRVNGFAHDRETSELLRAKSSLKEFPLRAARRFQTELPIRVRHRHATLRRALDVTLHDQIGLVHFFKRARFFADRDRQR